MFTSDGMVETIASQCNIVNGTFNATMCSKIISCKVRIIIYN